MVSYFEGAPNGFSQQHVIECFGAAITKKPHFLPKNGQNKAILWPKTVFEGAGLIQTGLASLWSARAIECFGAAITKKPHFLPKNGQNKAIFGLKRCFWSVSGQL